MKFLCGNCKTRYQIPEEKLRGKVLTIRCQKCSTMIVVRENTPSVKAEVTSKEIAAVKVTAPATPARGTPALQPSATPAFGTGVAMSSGPLASADIPAPASSGFDPTKVEWYTALDGAQKGPMHFVELIRRLTTREVDGQHHVWHDGMENWQLIRDRKDLAMYLPVDKKLPPPPPAPVQQAVMPPQSISSPGSKADVVDFASKRAERERMRSSELPAESASLVASASPSFAPTASPTFVPSASPSFSPSASPRFGASAQPSFGASAQPSFSASAQPSFVPSASPAFVPSASSGFGASAGFNTSAQSSFVPSATPSFSPNLAAKPASSPKSPALESDDLNELLSQPTNNTGQNVPITLSTVAPSSTGASSNLSIDDLLAFTSGDIFASIPRAEDESKTEQRSTRFFVNQAGASKGSSRARLVKASIGLGVLGIIAVAGGLSVLSSLNGGSVFSLGKKVELDQMDRATEDELIRQAMVKPEGQTPYSGGARRWNGKGKANDDGSKDGNGDPRGGDAEGVALGGISATGGAKNLEIKDAELPTLDLSHFTPVNKATLSKEDIETVVKSRQRSIKLCYQDSMKTAGAFHGKLELQVSLKPTGEVAKVKVLTAGAPAKIAGDCIADKVKDWKFPSFAGSENTDIIVPFVLQRSF